MATTPNYGLTLLEVGQKEKEVTINENFTALDTAIAALVPGGGGNEDLSAETLSLTGSLTYGPAAEVFVGDSNYGWKDITAEINIRGTGGNNPSWSIFRDGIYAYSFSDSSMKEAWLSFHVDHDYAPGTPVFLHVHWAPTTASSGTVRWGFEYSIAKGHQQQAFPATTTVYVEQASSGQYFHHVAEISTGVAATNIEPDSLILVRVFRDATHVNDTFPGPVAVFTSDIHHQVSRFATKNRAPNFYS